MNSIKKRIDEILGRNTPAIGGVNAQAISVIRELEAENERLKAEKHKTLRDEFAAQAITGVCSDGTIPYSEFKRLVENAYDIADAMLEARKQ